MEPVTAMLLVSPGNVLLLVTGNLSWKVGCEVKAKLIISFSGGFNELETLLDNIINMCCSIWRSVYISPRQK